MAQDQYWFNTKTRQVDVGHQVSSKDLLGPYPTRQDAEAALAKAAARTEAWDREDADD